MGKGKIENQHGEDTGLIAVNMPEGVISEEQRAKEDELLAYASKLNKKTVEKAESITTRYWEAKEKGDTIVGVFRGWKQITNSDDQKLIAAIIKTDNGVMICAATILVETLFEVKPMSLLHIEYTGKKGRLNLYDIKVLKQAE